jgi:hypothetical protein
VGVDESMPATMRDLWARFMASALMEIRLSHETDESTSPKRQQAQTRGYCGLYLPYAPVTLTEKTSTREVGSPAPQDRLRRVHPFLCDRTDPGDRDDSGRDRSRGRCCTTTPVIRK